MSETEIRLSVYARPDEYTVQLYAKLDRETYRKLMELLTDLGADVTYG